MMRCEVVIRTALGLLIETQVEVERTCDAIGAVLARPDVAAHLCDLKFSAINVNVRPLIHGIYADVRPGAAEGERSAA
jgi:hypothetical protein